jgi:hypothetical protein
MSDNQQLPADDVRRQRVQRAVADKVTDEMLTKPSGQLTEVEAAILMAALSGPHADEIMARIDALIDGSVAP